MDINRNNYQEYAAEWLEGTLSGDALAAFEHFLDGDPDLRVELEAMRDLTPFEVESSTRNLVTDFSDLKRTTNDKMVNRDNFLELVMARLDGELNESSVAALDAWLMANPDCKKEASLFEATLLQPDTSIAFPGKEDLKQGVRSTGEHLSKEAVEELIISSLEGDLTEAEEQKLQAYLAEHHEAAESYRLFALTFLQPDEGVVYQGRGALKQRTVIPLFSRQQLIRTVAVAASIALLAGVFLFSPTDSEPTMPSGNNPVQVAVQPELPLPAGHSQAADPAPPIAGTTPDVVHTVTSTPTLATVEPEVIEPETTPYTPYPISTETLERFSPRIAQSITSGHQITPEAITLPASTAQRDMNLPEPPQSSPARRTIEAFPVEQIRYVTTTHEEGAGLLGEVSISRLVAMARPYDRINNAGKQLTNLWVQLKENAIQEVLPLR